MKKPIQPASLPRPLLSANEPATPRTRAIDVEYDEFPIEQGIPIPRPQHVHKYPHAKLRVGESFFAPNVRKVGRPDSLADRKFINRSVIEKGVKGVRVWRIK